VSKLYLMFLCRWRRSKEGAPVSGREQRGVAQGDGSWHLEPDGQHPQPVGTGGAVHAEETGKWTSRYGCRFHRVLFTFTGGFCSVAVFNAWSLLVGQQERHPIRAGF